MPDPEDVLAPVDRSRLLARDYWLVLWKPHPTTTKADIETHVDDHLRWLLDLEATGELVMSGPLLAGPQVAPGSGVTVLRADSEVDASSVASMDPFVLGGLRSFDVFRWQVNEGSIRVQLSLGTGTYQWL